MPNDGADSVVSNLRRIAARLRGEDVPGLEAISASDGTMLAAAIEHEALHLEIYLVRTKCRPEDPVWKALRAGAPPSGPPRPSVRASPDWTGRTVQFEDDGGNKRYGTVEGASPRNGAYLRVSSDGTTYEVHGCMVRHFLTAQEEEIVREQYLAWVSRGPRERYLATVDAYAGRAEQDLGMPASAVHAFLTKWAES